LSGWQPYLVHLGACKYDAPSLFRSHHALADHLQLVLAAWLFPGALVHLFTAIGEQAFLPVVLKHRPTVLDLYDTSSGFTTITAEQRELERTALQHADALTVRDLRIRYLERMHGYATPRSQIFIHDPLPEIPRVARPARPPGDPLRVVSIGWVGSGDNSILRLF
jgi:hypothetical protein